MDIPLILIVFFSTAIAALLSSMSGGGASVISLPIFLWAGIPLPLSIATQKVSSVFWTPISAWNYLKDRKIDWRFLLIFALIGLIGAYFGVQAVILIDPIVLSKIIGVIILFLVAYTYLKKDLGLKEKRVTSPIKRAFSYVAAVIMGFYESILGSGNGIAFAALTFHTRGFDFIDALGYYFAIAFFWVTFASALLINQGYFDASIMISAILGSIIGSYFGSKYAKFKGNKFIKNVFLILGTFLGLKLLLL